MFTKLIDLAQPRAQAPEDLQGLNAHLLQLVGEPFRFARVSYGDELTLHFGDLRPARSPKLKGLLYGSYILGVRGSHWLFKSTAAQLVLSDGIAFHGNAADFGSRVSKEDLEKTTLIQPDSRVVSVTAFEARPANGFGLVLTVSDGGAVIILPSSNISLSSNEAGGLEEELLSPLADWELSAPAGLLSAGPSYEWAFKPSAEFTAKRA